MDYQTCPGETECETEETGRIYRIRKREPDRGIEEICKNCGLLPTKPGQEPPHLTAAIWIAGELDAIRSSGGTFAYPDALTPLEWACLTALMAGRGDSEAQKVREDRDRATREHKLAELRRLSGS